MKNDTILLAHGSGGLLSQRLIENHFLPHFDNSMLNKLDDGAVFEISNNRLCISTDSYVIDPLFFPGGDIGKLAVCGTINDLAMCGAQPLYLSVGIIIEEGFKLEELDRVITSMANTAREANVKIITGDTKVVPHGKADKLFINTSGVGHITYKGTISGTNAQHEDKVILSGAVGDHGMAVMSKREGLSFSSTIRSDVSALHGLVNEILTTSPHVHCMRDATRGGLVSVLKEIADQSKKTIYIDEDSIPVHPAVRGACEILGLDPLHVANEGKMVAIVKAEDADSVLSAMRSHPLGEEAAIIGQVKDESPHRVILTTSIGGKRILDRPAGALLPRIC
ncbi:MAG: hydrogenase expression/formation protein HypE [bacterium]